MATGQGDLMMAEGVSLKKTYLRGRLLHEAPLLVGWTVNIKTPKG